MAKKTHAQSTKSCSDCVHEYACRMWTDGRMISDESASRCTNHTTVKESGAYLIGKMDGEKHATTTADVAPRAEWISVEKKRLPDNCRAVLVALEGLTIGGAPAMVIGSYSGGFWMIADADGTHYLTKYMRYKVTHWMPLPEPPKGDAS